jgi:hypothetical protein
MEDRMRGNKTKISFAGFMALVLEKIVGNTFARITYTTDQTVLNKGRGAGAMETVLGINPDNIRKHGEMVVSIPGTKTSYERFVNGRLKKEGKPANFVVAPRPWGEHLAGHQGLVTHKGKMYLNCLCVANGKPTVEYTYNGKTIDLNDPKFDAWRKPAKVEGARQGTDAPIVCRTVAFENLKEVRLYGVVYVPVAE